jgi:hypothetical protein
LHVTLVCTKIIEFLHLLDLTGVTDFEVQKKKRTIVWQGLFRPRI